MHDEKDIEVITWRDRDDGRGEVMYGYEDGIPYFQPGDWDAAQALADHVFGTEVRKTLTPAGVTVWRRARAA